MRVGIVGHEVVGVNADRGVLAELAKEGLEALDRDVDVHVLDHAHDGLKPKLVAALGATYHCEGLKGCPQPDVIVEATGAPQLVVDAMGHTAPDGIVCLSGWLEQVITRRVPLERWPEALERKVDDAKVVVDFSG